MENGELKKMVIEAHDKADYSGKPIDTFKVMFNPENYSRKYAVKFKDNQGAGDIASPQTFESIEPESYDFTFTLDGTGVSGTKVVVNEEIEHFLDVTGRNNGDIHRPNYLLITWGTLLIKGVFKSADINYKLFSSDGKPIRAEIKASFAGAMEDQRIVAEADNKSPDLTHARIVKQGDNLPLMVADIYINPAPYYLQVAAHNGLNNFRRLRQGQQLNFPPVKKGEA